MAERWILAGVPDLFFASKISGAAKAVGARVRMANSRGQLVEAAAEGPALIVLDLGAAALEPAETIREIKAAPNSAGAPIVGFVHHERADLIEAARRAGCDQVLARGAFSARLPELLAPRS